MKKILLLLVFLLASCDTYTYWKDDKYQVWTFDNEPILLSLDLGKGASVRKIEDVIPVGSNEFYVVAETREHSFFFIKKSEDEFDSKKAIYGPYTKDEFDGYVKKYNLPEFEWRYGS
ncbi:hypothetical protein [Pseudoalteromonas xiamenensis]